MKEVEKGTVTLIMGPHGCDKMRIAKKLVDERGGRIIMTPRFKAKNKRITDAINLLRMEKELKRVEKERLEGDIYLIEDVTDTLLEYLIEEKNKGKEFNEVDKEILKIAKINWKNIRGIKDLKILKMVMDDSELLEILLKRRSKSDAISKGRDPWRYEGYKETWEEWIKPLKGKNVMGWYQNTEGMTIDRKISKKQ